jgi:hypothetical protein
MFRPLRMLALTGAALFSILACSNDDDDPAGVSANSRLRVVHAAADAGPVIVWVDERLYLQNQAFGSAGFFFPVAAGDRRIRVGEMASPDTLCDATLPVAAQTTYTLIAVGPVASAEPILVTEDITVPAAGQSKLRVIHAAPAAGAVDVYVTAPTDSLELATPVLTNVTLRTVSAFLSVAPGTYRVRVTPTGTFVVAIDALLTIDAGQVRTVVAVDKSGGGVPLGAIVLVDFD